MAGGGVGEAMLIGAAVGAGTGGVMSAVKDEDPLQGALLGAALGAAGGGIGSGIGGMLGGEAGGLAGGEAGGALGGEAGGAGAGAVSGTTGGGGGGVFGTVSGEATGTVGGYAGGTGGGAGGATGGGAGGGAGFGSGAGFGDTTGAMFNSGASFGSSGVPVTGDSFVGSQLGAQGGGGANWGAQGLGEGFAPGLTNAQAYGAGAGGGIMGLIGNSQNQGEQWAPEAETYSGPLSQFKYDPNKFRPSVAPGYADGGVASLGPQVGMYPQSQLPDRTQFATPSQMPISRDVVAADYDSRINPYSGDMMMARGGISSLGSYSDGGRMLRGPGDGMSDDIPGVIAGKQPARLADGEFVVPADVVSHLGNGSTDAGAKKLYSMMDNVRKARTGSKKQGKQIKADKYMPAMKRGGIAYYDEGGDTSSEETPATKADVQAAIDSARGTPAGMSTDFQPSGYTGAEHQYTPYTMSGRPSSAEPQYYQDIYQGFYPDYSTPGYTLTGGNLGEWSNVAGEQARAAQPASMNQMVTQSYLQGLGRAPDTQGFNYWMQTGLPATDINKQIQTSPEAGNIMPNETDYISRLYQQYLGRSPDAAGLEYWQQQLGPNLTSAQVSQQIQQSEEAKRRNGFMAHGGIASLNGR